MEEELTFGRFFRHLRVKRGKTLRRFCLDNRFDPGNMSKLERDRMRPPASREKLEEYAHVLGLEEGSDDWYEFFDLAALSRGEVPPEILSDQEVVSRLPLVFRTLRGQRVPPEQIDELVDFIRRSELGA